MWAINLVVGVFIARYERHTIWWNGAHRVLQMISTVITFPAYYVAYNMVSVHYQSAHSILGFVMIVSLTIQSSMGSFFYEMKKFKLKQSDLVHMSDANFEVINSLNDFITRKSNSFYRWVVNSRIDNTLTVVHSIFGKLLVILIFVQIYLGVELFRQYNIIGPLAFYIYLFWAVILAALFIYKETELSCNLPKGYVPKLMLMVTFIANTCCHCCMKEDKKAVKRELDHMGSTAWQLEGVGGSNHNLDMLVHATSNPRIVYESDGEERQQDLESDQMIIESTSPKITLRRAYEEDRTANNSIRMSGKSEAFKSLRNDSVETSI